MLKKAFGDDAMSQPRVYEWYRCFQEGREDVEDGTSPVCPRTSIIDGNVKKIKPIVRAYRRITIRDVTKEIKISYGSCGAVFTNVLNMKIIF